MKRWLCPLLLALLLSGCAGEAPQSLQRTEEPPAASEAESAAASASPEAEGDLSAQLLETGPRTLSEEEIVTAYNRAVTAYGWFVLAPLPDTGEVVTEDNTAYRRVDAKGMTELDDLRNFLNGIFAPAVTEQLLEGEGGGPTYREIDGALYVTGMGRVRDPSKGAVRVQTEQISPMEYAVNVAVDLLDDGQGTVTGSECWSFPYVFTGDRWVFTDFHLVF